MTKEERTKLIKEFTVLSATARLWADDIINERAGDQLDLQADVERMEAALDSIRRASGLGSIV